DEVQGEEAGASCGSSGVRWLVDPIDGTTNYLYRRPDWAISIAAVRIGDGQILAGVVAEPALDLVTEARLGCGAWVRGHRVRCSQPRDLSCAVVELNLGLPEQRARAGRVIDALV